MNIRDVVLLNLLFFIKCDFLKSQDLEFHYNNIEIKIAIEYKNASVSQWWKIINKSETLIYVPISKSNFKMPIHDVAKIGNDISIAIGQAILFQGIPLEMKVLLAPLNVKDSVCFEVEMIDKFNLNKISISDYLDADKWLVLDYITSYDMRDISSVGIAYKTIAASDYARKAKFIHLKSVSNCLMIE